MPINQPNSALARAAKLIEEAIIIAHEHDPDGSSIPDLRDRIDRASGALNFAGNSQQRLIDACRETEAALKKSRVMSHVLCVRKCREAIAHAEGPGID